MSDVLSKTVWRALLKQQKGASIKKTGISDLLDKVEAAAKTRDTARQVAAYKALIARAQTLKKEAPIKGLPKVVKHLTDMIDEAQEEMRKVQVGETEPAQATEEKAKPGAAEAKEDDDDKDTPPLAKHLKRAQKADREHPVNFAAAPGKPSSGLVLSRRTLTNQDVKAAVELRGKKGAFFTGICFGESGWIVFELENAPPSGLAKGIKLAAKLHADMPAVKVKVRGGGVEITDEDDDDADLEEAGGAPDEPKAGAVDYPGKDVWVQRIKKVASLPPDVQAEASTGVYGQITRYQKLLAEDQTLTGPERALQDKLLKSVRAKLDQVLAGAPGSPSPRVDRGEPNKYDSLEVWRGRIEGIKRLDDEQRHTARDAILVALKAAAEKIRKDATLSPEARDRELKILTDARELLKTASRHQSAVKSGAERHDVVQRMTDAEARLEALLEGGAPDEDAAALRKAHAKLREALKHTDAEPLEAKFAAFEKQLTDAEAKAPEPVAEEAPAKPSRRQRRLQRRVDKTRASLAILDDDDDDRMRLEGRIGEAEKNQDVSAAYHDLKEVKFEARRLAAVKRDGLCASDIADMLRPLLRDSQRMENFHAGALQRQKARALEIFGNLGDLEPVSRAKTKDEAFRRLQDLNGHLQAIRTDLAGLEAATEQDKRLWIGMLAERTDWDSVLKRATHDLAMLKKEKPDQFKPELQQDVGAIVARIKKLGLKGGGDKLTIPLDEGLRDLNAAYDEKVKHLKKFDGFDAQRDSLTDDDGTPVPPDEIEATKAKMAHQFEAAEARAAERLERAKEEYLEAKRQDEVLSATSRTGGRRRRAVGTFDTAEFFDDLYQQLQDGRDAAPGQLAQNAHAAFQQTVADLMANEPDGDALYDLAARSDAEWKQEITRSIGAPTDKADQTPEQTELIGRLAEDMARTVRETFPNKMEADLSQMTVGGEVYANPQKLGNGANATAYRYTNQTTGEAVVVKIPNAWTTIYQNPDQLDQTRSDFADEIENARAIMGVEARNHRQAAGGEDGECHPNILDQKGLALGPGGEPLVVMEMADAGDADDFSRNVDAACDAGVISDNARHAVMKNAVRQVVRGLKELQDQNMAHFDLKEENVFLRSDGTFAVADFGGSQRLDGPDQEAKYPMGHTPFYDAPEIDGPGKITAKADNFSLGVMLQNMMDLSKRTREVQMIREKESMTMFSRDQSTSADGAPMTESSLSRLANALLDPDPSKRPTPEAVLFSSFFSDQDDAYDDDDLNELMQASAAYSKAVGGRVADRQKEIGIARNRIARLELEKTGQAEQIDIEVKERELKAQRGLLEKITQELEDFTRKEKAALDAETGWALRTQKQMKSAIDNTEKDIEDLERQLQGLKDKLGAPRTEGEIRKCDAEIAEKRAEIAAMEQEIEDLHQHPTVAPHVTRLKAANKPFENRA